MGLNLGGDAGDEFPQNLGEATLMQIVRLRFCRVFNISSTRFKIARSKKFTNPITLTEYSLFPRSTSSTSTKLPLQAENSTFFWRGHG